MMLLKKDRQAKKQDFMDANSLTLWCFARMTGNMKQEVPQEVCSFHFTEQPQIYVFGI